MGNGPSADTVTPRQPPRAGGPPQSSETDLLQPPIQAQVDATQNRVKGNPLLRTLNGGFARQ